MPIPSTSLPGVRIRSYSSWARDHDSPTPLCSQLSVVRWIFRSFPFISINLRSVSHLRVSMLILHGRNLKFFFFFDPGRGLKILISDDDVRWSGLEKFGIEGRDTNREREFEKRKGEWMDEGERWNHGERACAISSVRAHGSLTKPMRPC